MPGQSCSVGVKVSGRPAQRTAACGACWRLCLRREIQWPRSQHGSRREGLKRDVHRVRHSKFWGASHGRVPSRIEPLPATHQRRRPHAPGGLRLVARWPHAWPPRANCGCQKETMAVRQQPPTVARSQSRAACSRLRPTVATQLAHHSPPPDVISTRPARRLQLLNGRAGAALEMTCRMAISSSAGSHGRAPSDRLKNPKRHSADKTGMPSYCFATEIYMSLPNKLLVGNHH